jgi:hypothetical protein
MVVAFQAAVHWIVERELTRTLDARVRIDRLRVFPLTARLTASGLSSHEKVGRQPLLRLPVHGDLDRPEFDLADAIATAVQNAVKQMIAAPFRAIGEIFTLGGKIGAIEIAPVRFAPGSWALDDAARQHLRNIGAVLRGRPGMMVKLAGMAHVESDEDNRRAQPGSDVSCRGESLSNRRGWRRLGPAG